MSIPERVNDVLNAMQDIAWKIEANDSEFRYGEIDAAYRAEYESTAAELASGAGDEVVEGLDGHFDSPDELARAAATVLSLVPWSERVGTALNRWLQHPDLEVRRRTMRGFQREEARDGLASVLEVLSENGMRGIGVDAVNAAFQLDRARAIQCATLVPDDADSTVRKAVAFHLRKLPDPRARTWLLFHVGDPSGYVRGAAITALLKGRHPRAGEAFLEVLRTTKDELTGRDMLAALAGFASVPEETPYRSVFRTVGRPLLKTLSAFNEAQRRCMLEELGPLVASRRAELLDWLLGRNPCLASLLQLEDGWWREPLGAGSGGQRPTAAPGPRKPSPESIRRYHTMRRLVRLSQIGLLSTDDVLSCVGIGLSDGDSSVQKCAAELAVVAPDPRHLPLLVRADSAPSEAVAKALRGHGELGLRAALDALGETDRDWALYLKIQKTVDRRSTGLLVEHLEDRLRTGRPIVARLLADLRDPRAIPALREVAGDPQDEASGRARLALAEMGATGVGGLLAEMLDGGFDVRDQRAALRLINELNLLTEVDVDQLISIAEQTEDSSLGQSLLAAFEQFQVSRSVPAIRHLLAHIPLRVLQRLGKGMLQEPWTQVTDDDRISDARLEEILRVGELASSRIPDLLWHWIVGRGTVLSAPLGESLRTILLERVFPAVCSLLENPTPSVRIAAAWLVSTLGSDAVSHLIEVLESSENALRRVAVTGLGGSGVVGALPAVVREYAKPRSLEFRRATERAILELVAAVAEREPSPPTPEASGRVQRLIDARGEDDRWSKRLSAQGQTALPVLATPGLLVYGVRPDGTVLELDLDTIGDSIEVETDPLRRFAVCMRGAVRHAELIELLPKPPADIRPCHACRATGGLEDPCGRCNSMGWVVPPPPTWTR